MNQSEYDKKLKRTTILAFCMVACTFIATFLWIMSMRSERNVTSNDYPKVCIDNHLYVKYYLSTVPLFDDNGKPILCEKK